MPYKVRNGKKNIQFKEMEDVTKNNTL